MEQASVDASGRKTDNYYYSKAAHEEICSFENAYMSFVDDWLGVLAYDGQENSNVKKPWVNAEKLLKSYPRIQEVSAGRDLLIGVMKDAEGYEGFMLANQALPTANIRNEVSVVFNDADKALVYIDGRDAQLIDLQDGRLDITLKSGGGAFVIPVKVG